MNAPTETYTVRIVPNPAPSHQSWLPAAAPEVPALCGPDGSVHRYLGFDSTLPEAVAKAEDHMARWATPRHVVVRKDLGDSVELVAVVGEVVG